MEEKEHPSRKQIRLPEFDYSENRMYFITICSKDKEKTFGRVVGDGACDVPQVVLSPIGTVIEKIIRLMDNKYYNVFIDKYVIMPNHVHMIIAVSNAKDETYKDNFRASYFGTSRAPSPTEHPCDKVVLRENDERTNKIIPKFISVFKRSCNHDIGNNICQRSYYDHVLRNYQDYRCTWLYIDNNPARWTEDEYY